jgi:hypothetical protein
MRRVRRARAVLQALGKWPPPRGEVLAWDMGRTRLKIPGSDNILESYDVLGSDEFYAAKIRFYRDYVIAPYVARVKAYVASRLLR